ncbi:cysteine hydrolase [Thermaerobacter composti]|uniref:Cysteine hydrolase n=1 Tax=Thermaerobacter composti TaxID=554949 RepID=A0ABZ0QNB9_9FIRM|nr:cysteine hydrolase [Thermaerobacter composti]WPD18533.1 cysteine hydrolase [Thermaerobacter composti]
MRTVDLVDRSQFREMMNQRLVIDPKRTVVVTVDMHRGHLDPAVATMPTDPDDARRVVAAAARVLHLARRKGLPVIHVVMTNRRLADNRSEAYGVPFWEAVEALRETLTPGRASTAYRHNLEGSIQTEIIPDLYQPGDYVVNSKKRLSCFYGTDLEVLLRVLQAQAVVLMGINTNTCVLCTAFEVFNRDMAPIVIEDCVASMYGPDLHVFGLENVSRCLGWVLSAQEFAAKLGEPDWLVQEGLAAGA